MKRTLSRSLLNKAKKPESEENIQNTPAPVASVDTSGGSAEDAPAMMRPRIGGAGSAWKSGALAQSQASLERSRTQIADDILNGRHELQLSPDQITDPVGTDRRDDWMQQREFQSLVNSIKGNGQDTPILVWPEDENWKPDNLNPENVADVRFILLTGRRRHAAAEKLGLSLRAVLANPEKRNSENRQFEMLFFRFRENKERENLGPFENLLSIGEMYETLRKSSEDGPLYAKAFANLIGVHESTVSRGRAVYKARKEILNIFKNVYDMSFPELQKALSSLSNEGIQKVVSQPKPKKLAVNRKIGKQNLSVVSQGGKLSVKAAGLKLDKKNLEHISEMIASYLEQIEADASSK
ncbi:MAG: ParB N-terminal domain-containing protein [Rhizobiaceae bacterium]